MQPYSFSSARELFESAREASKDAERIRRQLLELEQRASSIGGGGFEARVSSTSDPDKMGRRVGAMVDAEAALRLRQDEDYRLIDAACMVLYGEGGRGGLAALVPPWWADVMWWRYLADESWERIGSIVGYSAHRCWEVAQTALEVADANGMAGTVEGMGGAES